jgi:phosphotransferase system enzyme I (PtsI)
VSEARPKKSPRVDRRGIAVSPGVGIGTAFVVEHRQVAVPHTKIEREEVDEEVKRFYDALRASQEQLESIKSKLHHGEHRQILKAQQMMLRDPDMRAQVEARVRENHICAEWAVAQVTDEIRVTFSELSDDYIRERSFDVGFLASRILRNLAGDQPTELHPPEGAVIVAHDLSPADTAHLHRYEVQGIVTEVGGQTSHTAIMARALSIPAVVGVDKVLQEVETGDPVIVDAVHRTIIVRPTEAEIEHYSSEAERYAAFEKEIHKEHALPAVTKDGLHVALRANVAIAEEVPGVRKFGAEGVGLYRTEFFYLDREELPTEEDHYRDAKKVLQACSPYPVTFRTFDIGSDKRSDLFEIPDDEANPALGLRSLRLALKHREVFQTQIRGLMRAALHGPLRIMLPLVSGLHELELALEVIEEAKKQLEDAGMAHAEKVPVGIMIEVPSAAVVADVLAKRVDFLSIGTNDLIQYCLAIDRESEDVNYLYEPLHPAILRLIKMVCEAGKANSIPVSMCGEMAADPRFTWVLIGLGVEELSMHPSGVPVIKNIIRGSHTREMGELAAAALEAESGRAARRIVVREMGERFTEHLEHGGGTGEGEEEAESEAEAGAPGPRSSSESGPVLSA